MQNRLIPTNFIMLQCSYIQPMSYAHEKTCASCLGISLFCFYFHLFFFLFFALTYYAQCFAQSFNILLEVNYIASYST